MSCDRSRIQGATVYRQTVRRKCVRRYRKNAALSQEECEQVFRQRSTVLFPDEIHKQSRVSIFAPGKSVVAALSTGLPGTVWSSAHGGKDHLLAHISKCSCRERRQTQTAVRDGPWSTKGRKTLPRFRAARMFAVPSLMDNFA